MLLRHAVDLLDEGVVITDQNYEITYVNPAYVQIFELQNERIIGENIKELFPHEDKSKQITAKTIEDKIERSVERLPYKWRGKEMVLQIYTKTFEHEGKSFVLTRVYDLTETAEGEKQLVQMIEDMTANVVTIAKGYALLPLQPILREEQKHILLERVPEQCRDQNISRLAIQFSGISSINQEWAVLLKNLVRNLQLLGIEVVLAGLRPQVVMQFTQNGVELADIKSFMNVQQATKYFLETGFRPHFK
ncbi:PAS domain-containing protein [Halobacillus sp. A1]|uniref:PAS domain-containing protein n=1 Tax=Halobacillus sp. A1 TaxID=2880262 RepID=UPI0020A62F61|nr:PAS domain-containing protein [Halobacillus sp. A1]MCP3030224.1 PAS domain-containing protein [Halobacillus sp. A1]